MNWKFIKDNNLYEVSEFGDVRSVKRLVVNTIYGSSRNVGQKRLSPFNNGKGYLAVTTTIDYKKKNYYIHRLVAEAFIPNPDNKPEVNHKDGNKSNNHFKNLEWNTLKENRDHAKNTGLMRGGEQMHSSKLKLTSVIEIIDSIKSNPDQNKSKLARKYGVCDTTIHKIIKGKRWVYALNKHNSK